MSDVTFMRGYGFPRGSKMDYAGYAGAPRGVTFRGGHGFAGMLVPSNYGTAPRARPVAPYMPEPSVFAPIPALDGFNSDEAFGTELLLPTLDLNSGQWLPEDQTGGGAPRPAPSTLGAVLPLLAVGGLALWLLTRR